jgi:mRNA interferase MazF
VGTPTAGSVVLVTFPFSDLSQAKLRPAVVLADAGRGDFVLCQVTSNAFADPLAIELQAADFASGSLHRTSYARPGKLFTANRRLIAQEVGALRAEALERVVNQVVKLLRRGTSV